MGGCASKENAAKEQKKEDDTGFVQFLLMSHAWVNSTMSMGRAWNYVEASLYVVFPVSWLYILSMHFAFSFFFPPFKSKLPAGRLSTITKYFILTCLNQSRGKYEIQHGTFTLKFFCLTLKFFFF